MFDVFYTGPKPNLFAFERPAASLEEADTLCRTEYFWYVNGLNDYSDFDFWWRPVSYERDHTHVWPSQWQQNGGTYFVPKGTKEHQWHWHDEYVNRVMPTDIFYMDFMNPESKPQFERLKQQCPNIKSTRYVSDHLNVLRRIVNLATTEYVWVISSVCDYKEFDFTWHPAQWHEEMIHCFSDGVMKRGDTFYIHVESFKRQMVELELLDWFNVINYSTDQFVNRYAPPAVVYEGDDLISVIKNYKFETPYAFFTPRNDIVGITGFNNCLWSEKDRVVESFTSSNAICAVPRDVKTYLDKQIYDYPYIIVPKEGQNVYYEEPLDIVYISNGEPDAERWYNHLSNVMAEEEQGYPNLKHTNSVKRVKNIDGRMAAYKAAATASDTPWFFAVFAKLEVDPGFDWSWQPDYFQEPKHYIFHARNPVNGLEYGHMSLLAYNKRLVLETSDPGLDFTLSQPHETVPMLSGTAHFNQDQWTTWRTAFREVLKLKYFSVTHPNVETNYRLKTWATKASGDFAEYSLMGAADALDYYEQVNGNYEDLKKSFEWNWLKTVFNSKYGSK